MRDVTESDLALAIQYNNYMQSGNYNAAIQILQNNPQLKDVIINAENLNVRGDAIKALETYFFENCKDNWLKVYNNKGTWSANTQYKFFDVVTYEVDNVEQLFLCVQHDTPIGTFPTDTYYFKKLVLRGEQGVSGSGMSPRGYYSTTTQYYKDDCVAYNNILWYAKVDNIGQIPQVPSSYWDKLMEMPKQVIVSAEEPSNQVAGDVWFKLV